MYLEINVSFLYLHLILSSQNGTSQGQAAGKSELAPHLSLEFHT